MWSSVQRIFHAPAPAANDTQPPAVPLRRAMPGLSRLAVGHIIHFSKQCPLPPLTGATAKVTDINIYRFGAESITCYRLKAEGAAIYQLIIAEDALGQYLGISRQLNTLEQDQWFGRDALGFFTEESSAKSIRCKADLVIEGEWAAVRYSKSVHWAEGTVAPANSPRLVRALHYNLLTNEEGDKALEIEHEDVNGDNHIYVTVYRPLEDIERVEEAPAESSKIKEIKHTQATDIMPAEVFASEVGSPKKRQDFRRLQSDPGEPIRIERMEENVLPPAESTPELPGFLLGKESTYISLDDIIEPETERVRVSIEAAYRLMGHALKRQSRVRDVLRELLGLQSALSDEVLFELPLTEVDYQTLAMRYKLRPDHRIEIRSRLEEELRQKLLRLSN